MDKMKNFKNSFQEFCKEEILMALLLSSSIFYFLFHIINEKKELFNNFTGVVELLFYDLSIAIFMGVIFYFLQVFYPKRNIRLVANRDINYLINLRLHRLFYSIFQHYTSDELHSTNSSKQNIYNKKYVKIVADNLKLNDIIKWSWNKNKKTWLDEINEVVKKFDIEYEKIIVKYSSVIPWEIFKNFEYINRNIIFISSRDGTLSQSEICQITIEELFICMKKLRNLSRELSSLSKQNNDFDEGE